MPYKREQEQVLNTIKTSGNGAKANIHTSTADPMGGGTAANLPVEVYFVQADYSSRDIADPTIAAGLMKILVPAIDAKGVAVDLEKLVMDKTAKVVFASGKSLGIRKAKVTTPDGLTPIVARLFLGG